MSNQVKLTVYRSKKAFQNAYKMGFKLFPKKCVYEWSNTNQEKQHQGKMGQGTTWQAHGNLLLQDPQAD